jgi:predicted TIM-barrel fold metal-dependent hydrolase
MRLDVHAHYFSPEYLDLLERSGMRKDITEPGRRTMMPSRSADFSERFEAMQKAQIQKQVLSVSGVAPYHEDEPTAVACARFVNDEYAALVRDHPDRFAAYAVLPQPHVDASLREIARGLDELELVGVTMVTSILGRSLADSRWDPLYAELDRREAVLFIHPAGLGCGSPELLRTGLTWPLGAPFEDTMCILELMQAGFTERFPNIKTIVPHLGGTLPFLMQRLDHMAGRFMPGKGVPSELSRKFWYDTVNAYVPSLRAAVETYGIDRLVFGTDWPFWKGEAHQLAADHLYRAGLSDADLAKIDTENAKTIFGRRYPL